MPPGVMMMMMMMIIIIMMMMTQGGGSCKHAPGVSSVLGGAGVRHSHSMRDQTSHMREKYQQHRRLSIRTPNGSINNTPKGRNV